MQLLDTEEKKKKHKKKHILNYLVQILQRNVTNMQLRMKNVHH